MVRRGAQGDIRHVRTPEGERGPLWWLEEYTQAERAVTVVAAMAERDQSMCRVWDERIDHLANVDDTCEQILARVAVDAGGEVAEAARAHYIDGVTWAKVAAERGESASTTCNRVRVAVRGVAWPLAGG